MSELVPLVVFANAIDYCRGEWTPSKAQPLLLTSELADGTFTACKSIKYIKTASLDSLLETFLFGVVNVVSECVATFKADSIGRPDADGWKRFRKACSVTVLVCRLPPLLPGWWFSDGCYEP